MNAACCRRTTSWAILLGLSCLLGPVGGGAAADTAPADSEATLAAREQGLLQQFRDLEKSFLRLADLLASSDPRRAALLRNVFEQARQAELGDRLDTIVRLLEKNQLLKAGTGQSDAIDRMKELLAVLESGDADKDLADTKEEVKRFLARVSKLIAKQRGIGGSTEYGGDERALAERQDALAEETRDLAGDVGGFAKRMEPGDSADDQGRQKEPGDEGQNPESEGGEGEEQSEGSEGSDGPQSSGEQGEQGAHGEQGEQGQPSESDDESSRASRTRQRLQAAEKRMRDAQKRLEEANRREARAEQEKAIEELETARAELEEILRQMREEEVERLLVQLETRIRSMLRAERGVLAGAEKLADAASPAARELQLESARLGREQTKIGAEAMKALELVRDDGSAVAIPQALEQVRDDSLQAAARLARGDVGGTTRGILRDLVTGLEEMLAALEQAQRDQRDQKTNPSGGRPAEPGEQPLVDKLAELKMIRSLQMRVNTRTERFSQVLADGAEQADAPELMEALQRLAERQRSIQQAAHEIVSGRTE